MQNMLIMVIFTLAVLAAAALLSVKPLHSAEGFDTTAPNSSVILQYTNPLAQAIGTTGLTPNEAATVTANLQAATDGVRFIVHDSAPDGSIATTIAAPKFLGVPPEPELIAKAKRCEAIAYGGRGTCSALGTDAMADCGFCLKGGRTHDGRSVNGGMYISPADRATAETAAKAYGTPAVYSPTRVSATTCAPGYFFVKPSDCTDGDKQLSCALHGAVGGECGQCNDVPDQYVYIGPQPKLYTGRLRVIGEGALTVSTRRGTGSPRTHAKGTKMVWDRETVVNLPDIAEGDTLQITVQSSNNSNKAFVGQIESITGQTRMLALDTVVAPPGAAVRRLGTLGTSNLPGISSHPSMLQTAFWMWSSDATAASFVVQGMIPVTILNPAYPVDTARCPTGAFIMTAAGQKIMDTDPCRATGTPSIDCAKFLWTSGGCNVEGTGYPQTTQSVSLLGASKGSIAAAVTDLQSVMRTGKHTDGRTATRAEIVSATRSCSGQVLSACDGPFKNTGPHDPACLAEIYNNPATYSSAYPRCSVKGIASPIGPDGKPTKAVTTIYNRLGGVDNIRKSLKSVQTIANTSKNPAQQTGAIKYCYGMDILGNDPKTCPPHMRQLY